MDHYPIFKPLKGQKKNKKITVIRGNFYSLAAFNSNHFFNILYKFSIAYESIQPQSLGYSFFF